MSAGLSALLPVAVACADAPAAVPLAPRLTVDAAVPFSEAELAEALAPRWPSVAAAETVVVTVEAEGTISITVGERHVVLTLDGDTGPAAARRAAVAASTLAQTADLPGALPAPLPPLVRPRTVAAVRASTQPVFTVAVRGVAGTFMHLGAAVDARVAVGEDLAVVATAQGGAGPSASVGDLGLIVGDARVGVDLDLLRRRFVALAARMQLVVGGYHASGSRGTLALSRTAPLVGGSAALVLRVGSGRLGGVAAVGVDAYANRDDLRVARAPAVATPRVAGWVSLGLELEWP